MHLIVQQQLVGAVILAGCNYLAILIGGFGRIDLDERNWRFPKLLGIHRLECRFLPGTIQLPETQRQQQRQ